MPTPSAIDVAWRTKWHTDIVTYFAGLVTPVQIPTEYPNAPFVMPETGVWARLTPVLIDSTQVEFGNPRRFRDTIHLYVQLFCLAEHGQAILDPIRDRVVTMFRDRVEDELRWRVPRPQHVGRSDKWYQMNVLCPFDTDTLVP